MTTKKEREKMIRKIVLSMVLMTLVLPAYAETEGEKLCAQLGTFARHVMKHRQNEVPMSTVLGTLEDFKDQNLKEILKQIVIDAYDRPSFFLEESKTSSIERFGNYTEVQCHKKT